jgi:hypothetical protein
VRPKPKPKHKIKIHKPATPLDAQKRQLAEREEQIQAEMARHKRLIEEAPRLAEEQKRRQREEYLQRVSRTEARYGRRGPTLHDPRFPYELNVAAAARQKTLRKDRNQGMLTFFVLCIILAIVLCWLYYAVLRDM